MRKRNILLICPIILIWVALLLSESCKKKDTTTTTPALAVGQSYEGGVIGYIYQSGDPGYVSGETHGIIATTSDQSSGIQWYNGNYVQTNATSTTDGKTNTGNIIQVQGSGSYAAELCHNLSLGGYSDWYLPSKAELIKLWDNRSSIGGFTVGNYWSSSEYVPSPTGNAWYYVTTAGGYQDYGNKANTFAVRPVRAF